MLVEVLASIGIGLVVRSLALLAFGGDSLVELFSGVAVLAELRSRNEVAPSNDNSSERTERVTSTLLFLLIPVIGLGVVFSYLTGLRPEGSPLGLVIAIAASLVMPYLYIMKRRIGKETNNPALSIDAIESLTCFFMAIALLVGLAAEYALGIWWADYVATAAILAFVAKEALESKHELAEHR
jgi:divalent metal cation (Fe/Co/Zn/Cd) transporter